MILVVTIHAPKGGTSQTLRFAKSPIRIGRNQLNDISLDDPFVSEWHGTIRFDRQSVAYFDLGSTNGTVLEGARLVKNVATPLTETSRLKVGLLYIQVAREMDDEQTTPPPASPGSEMQHTMPWGLVNRAALSGPRGGAATGAVVTGPGGSGAIRVNPGSSGSSMPGSAALPGLPPSASTASPFGVGGGAGWSPDAPTAPPISREHARDPAAGLGENEHTRRLLEAFTEAFIGLRKGYEQFGAEVGVRTINGNTPLHRARSQRELLDYVMQPNLDTDAIARDIIAIFADFGIHHIAMMQGVTEGVRTLLQSLSPRANDLDAGARLFSGGKAKTQWKAYLERFEQMINDDNELHTAVFGNEFARAYASVTQGDGAKASGRDPSGDED
jgi:type VI secretion system protein ImpI